MKKVLLLILGFVVTCFSSEILTIIYNVIIGMGEYWFIKLCILIMYIAKLDMNEENKLL